MYAYKTIKLPDGTTRDEHRLIMEEELGRRLLRTEVVHHINGNPRDNRRENLEVQTLRAHGQHHLTKSRKCTAEGCDGAHVGRGYCNKHYLRLVRRGGIHVLLGHSCQNPKRTL